MSNKDGGLVSGKDMVSDAIVDAGNTDAAVDDVQEATFSLREKEAGVRLRQRILRDKAVFGNRDDREVG